MTPEELTADNPENTGTIRADHLTRFQSGNPGKPKGSRHKLQEDFLKDIQAAWETSGRQAITDMIADKPGEFVKMVAGLMPKEATLTINDHSELTDAELTDRVRQLATQLSPFLIDGNGETETGTIGAPSKELVTRVH